VVANGNEAVYAYLLNYFKHILVNPMEKTGTVIVIKANKAVAKMLRSMCLSLCDWTMAIIDYAQHGTNHWSIQFYLSKSDWMCA
jgi:hypothetical protein